MKLKKWLATGLAVIMAAGTLGVMAACGDPDAPKNPDASGGGSGTVTPGGSGDETEDTAIQYYLVGSGLGTLAVSNWDQTSTDESLKFTRTGNTAVITADLYEGDEFGIIHNQAWDGQMGTNILDAESNVIDEVAVFVEGGGYDVKNIKVAEGQSGKYKLTLTINSESDFATNSLKVERLEKYEVFFATWFDIDGTTQIAKTVLKQGEKLTSRAYTSNTMPHYYEFDKWYTTAECETAFDFDTAPTANVSLYAKIKESANADYAADTTTWKFVRGAEDIGELTKDETNYTQHNVFTGSLEMEEGDTFKITNGTVVAKFTMLGWAGVFSADADGTYTVSEAGNYKFTVVTSNTEGTITVDELFFEEIAPTYSGLAIVGFDGNWETFVDGVNPKMVETGEGTGIYKGIITIATVPEEPGFVPIKVATIVKNKIEWGEYNKGGDGATADGSGNYKITAPGTYLVTLNKNTNVLTVVAQNASYYIVGTFVDAQGTAHNFAVVDGLTPQFQKGDDDTYTATIVVTDVTSVSDYSWVKEQGGASAIFAFKVAYVEADGTTIDWGKTYGKSGDDVAMGGDANFYFTEAGTYTVTLDTAAGTVTWVKA